MESFDVVIVITVILFARLGVRLFLGYKKFKKNQRNE
jgi:hypothetical protein